MFPGDLSIPTGGYAYARNILPLLGREFEVSTLALPASFPFPSPAELQEATDAIRAADRAGAVFLIDGLAYGALPAAFIATLTAPIVALVHHPLGLEEGLSAPEGRRLLKSEAEALAAAAHIVVPSRAMSQTLQELFFVSPAKITIAKPGILRGKRSSGAPAGQPLHIVSAGAITPRKGFGILADALHAVRDLDWHATIAGSLERSPKTAAEVQKKLARYALTDRVRLAGTLDEDGVSALYSSGDVFALASLYEGYGMAFAEAMAHGLPVVASGGGAVADTVPKQAGFICAPDDAEGIANALRLLLTDAALRRQKAHAAWQHARTLPDWPETAAIILDVLKRSAK